MSSFSNFQNPEPNFKPRTLAIIFAIFGIISSVILYFLLREVFAGNWKIHQQLELANIPQFKIGDIAIPIGQISLRFYSVCILTGLLSGYAMTLYLAKFHYIAGTIIDRLLIGLVVFGLLGARGFYVLFNLPNFVGNPLNIITGLPQGGLAIFGALIAGIIYIWLYCDRFRFNLWEFLDFISPGLLLGQIFGRFGNFFNYEAYGPATSIYWKMYVPDIANISDLNQKFFHPTFLYEIIPNFFLLILLLFFYKNLTSRHAGLVFGLWAFFYGIIRVITEFFRLDALQFPLPFPITLPIYNFKIENLLISQIMALILTIGGLVVIFKRQNVLYLKKTMSEYFL